MKFREEEQKERGHLEDMYIGSRIILNNIKMVLRERELTASVI
jgi:hypothetical protein